MQCKGRRRLSVNYYSPSCKKKLLFPLLRDLLGLFTRQAKVGHLCMEWKGRSVGQGIVSVVWTLLCSALLF
jgi:hypothetical protein